MADLPAQSNGRAIATIEIEVLITPDGESHMIGGKPHTPDGSLAWNAWVARDMLDSAEIQNRWDEGGYPLRSLGGRITSLRRVECGEDIDIDVDTHRVEETPDA